MIISLNFFAGDIAYFDVKYKTPDECDKFIKIMLSSNNIYYDRVFKKWIIPIKSVNSLVEKHNKNHNNKILIDRRLKLIINQTDNFTFLNSNKDEIDKIGATMKLQPFYYQKEAIYFSLMKKNSLLVLPCGSGKTPIGVGICVEAYKRNLIKGKCLIIVKASLKYQWLNEVSKFSDLIAKVVESPSKAGKKFENQFEDCDIFIANYETLKNEDVYKRLLKKNIEVVYADEIHYINSHTSDRSKAAYRFNDVKYKIGATATPVTNNPINVYGIFKFINKDLFDWKYFQTRYLRYIGIRRPPIGQNLPELYNIIKEYTLIKTKYDIAKQLPSIMINKIQLDFSNELMRVNKSIFAEMESVQEQANSIERHLSKEDAEKNPMLMSLKNTVMELQTIAQEFADEPELLKISDSKRAKSFYINKKSPKLIKCLELVEDIINAGEKVCIFSKYDRMTRILEREIIKAFNVKVAMVNGTVDTKKRYEEIYTKFRDNDEYKVLIATNSLAEGANLSRCMYLIEYELADSYAIQTQRHGRLERADSIHSNVFVYQLTVNDSWDDIQYKVINKKSEYHNSLFNVNK